MALPDFADDSRWFVLASLALVAQNVSEFPNAYIPIPKVNINDISDYPFIRVLVNNPQAKPTWRLGCWGEFLVDEPNAEQLVWRFRCPLGRPSIHQKPDFLGTYRLRFDIPFWFERCNLFIWGYIP
jgi:hypothetical protein